MEIISKIRKKITHTLGVGDLIHFPDPKVSKDLEFFKKYFPLEDFSRQLCQYSRTMRIDDLVENSDHFIINTRFIFSKESITLKTPREGI